MNYYIEQIFQENQLYDLKKRLILSSVSTFLLTSIIVFITGCAFGYCLGHKCKKKMNESHISQNTDIELEENVAYSIT
jgi:Sec-independent protein secretion pathway component TatC